MYLFFAGARCPSRDYFRHRAGYIRQLRGRYRKGWHGVDHVAERAQPDARIDELPFQPVEIMKVFNFDRTDGAFDSDIGDARQIRQRCQFLFQLCLDCGDLLQPGSVSNRSSEALAAAQASGVAI